MKESNRNALGGNLAGLLKAVAYINGICGIITSIWLLSAGVLIAIGTLISTLIGSLLLFCISEIYENTLKLKEDMLDLKNELNKGVKILDKKESKYTWSWKCYKCGTINRNNEKCSECGYIYNSERD